MNSLPRRRGPARSETMEKTKRVGTMEVNRRVSPRRRARGQVECRLSATGQGSNLAQGLEDISETGARIALRVAVENGRRVELRLRGWGHRSPVVITAQVVWCAHVEEDSWHIGVRFERHLSYQDLMLLS